jgi:hypothetical protein
VLIAERDLASVELWQRSLERSRRRRALAENPRRGSRRKAVAGALSIAALSILAAPALADPDFGPGNSSKGPHDGGAKCHPPGQTVFEPGCK